MYAVIVTYNFDTPEVYLFHDPELAVSYLNELYTEQVHSLIENYGEENFTAEMDEDQTYASIVYHNYDKYGVDEPEICEYMFTPYVANMVNKTSKYVQ